MSVHKKCMLKSQQATVCTGKDNDDSQSTQPKFKMTSKEVYDGEENEIDDAADSKQASKSQFSNLLAQGIKRVNSANNLNIPTIVSSLTQNSRSLPQTPQHSPRKQSLISLHGNPFSEVVRKLEQQTCTKQMNNDEIRNLVEPLECWPLEDLMELAKSESENLYGDLEIDDRLNKINLLVNIISYLIYI